jgi:thiamine biosynthesis lipoprotein
MEQRLSGISSVKKVDRTRKIIFLFLFFWWQIGFAQKKSCLFNQKLPSMGSFLELQIVHDCDKKPEDQVFVRIQNELDTLESELSLYQPSSAIRKLNQSGQIPSVSADFLNTLKKSLWISEKTNGAFDVSIWPLIVLVKKSFELTGKPPGTKEIKKLRNKINYRKIKIKNSSLQFEEMGMQITLDGIAKGYAVDKVSQALLKSGIENYLVNFSGNMRWQGFPPGSDFWKVSLWDYKNKKAAQLIQKSQSAIASSGAEHRNFSEDRVWNHILDPRNLGPSHLWLTTSVVGPEAEVCDALSTATFVMPEAEIKSVFKKHFPDYQVWGQKLQGDYKCLVGCS